MTDPIKYKYDIPFELRNVLGLDHEGNIQEMSWFMQVNTSKAGSFLIKEEHERKYHPLYIDMLYHVSKNTHLMTYENFAIYFKPRTPLENSIKFHKDKLYESITGYSTPRTLVYKSKVSPFTISVYPGLILSAQEEILLAMTTCNFSFSMAEKKPMLRTYDRYNEPQYYRLYVSYELISVPAYKHLFKILNSFYISICAKHRVDLVHCTAKKLEDILFPEKDVSMLSQSFRLEQEKEEYINKLDLKKLIKFTRTNNESHD